MPRKRLEESWLGYLAEVIPLNASRIQVVESRKAYYAGAYAMFLLVNVASEYSEEQGAAILEEILAEVMQFSESMKQGGERP
jgi:hypothetical protein